MTDLGPQRQPASPRQIAAQTKQARIALAKPGELRRIVEMMCNDWCNNTAVNLVGIEGPFDEPDDDDPEQRDVIYISLAFDAEELDSMCRGFVSNVNAVAKQMTGALPIVVAYANPAYFYDGRLRKD